MYNLNELGCQKGATPPPPKKRGQHAHNHKKMLIAPPTLNGADFRSMRLLQVTWIKIEISAEQPSLAFHFKLKFQFLTFDIKIFSFHF